MYQQPSFISEMIISRVDLVTLKVEFCSGKAGVIIGIKWNLSDIRFRGSQINSLILVGISARREESVSFKITGRGQSLNSKVIQLWSTFKSKINREKCGRRFNKFNEILLTEIGYFNARVFRLEIKVI